MPDNEDPTLYRYAVMFEVSVINKDMTFTEKVFARDELTAVARAARTATLKGYEVIAVRQVEKSG